MYANMIWCMEQVRKEPAAFDIGCIIRNRWVALKALLQTLAARPEARRFHMRLGDIAFLPEFRTVVLAPRLVNDDNTAPLRAQFRNAVEQWERRARGELCRLIFDYTASHPEFGVDPLQLATTKFPCMCYRHKNDTLFYPAVLAHRCLLDVIPPRTSNMYEEAVLAQLTSSFSWSHESNRVWTHDDIFVDGTSEHSRRLIELCGKDPRRATASEMDDAGV